MTDAHGKRLPPLVALRAFEAVGRTGSVRGAADELAVSHTVVSRHLQNLESWAGLKLVHRSGRGLTLTAAGSRYHQRIAIAFSEIAQATLELGPQPGQSLSIWCIPGFAARRLVPRMPHLKERMPGCEIVLNPTLARPDLARGEADAEIVHLPGDKPIPGIHSELLAAPRTFPVASPALRARFAQVQRIDDLLLMPLIHEDSVEQWEDWFRLAGMLDVPPLRGPRLWHAQLAIEAAKLGQGVAIANETLVGEDIASGDLVEVVPSDVRLGGYYLRTAAHRWGDPDLACLRDWLVGLFTA